ncbi:Hemolysin, contains CBS domains [Nonlabens sp. Hel1_33_55]|uniref:CNNM domain-containing protein n=1 Tax=Nonlabens sp. Hel1_33_55 TaxID=1336802 RepID=UPI000875C64F|nr:hemolysin family protein [Nonlabens sp. Hel1_33_55]SCY32345.1 Hemolysin, contains CBS domains [Nonlabens sp. Hel1_33_55]
MGLLILYAIVSIFFSFVCSILEAVLLSITPTFLKMKKTEGATYTDALTQLKNDVDKPLIAILTLNTLAHTVGAILVGVQAESMVSQGFQAAVLGIPLVGVVSGIMTVLILVVSEIIPKTIGATYWQNLAGISTRVLVGMVAVLKYTGILWVLQLTTRAIGKSAHMNTMTREEFLSITETAEEEGVFHPSEGQYIKSLMNFNKIKVKDVMTPRSVMYMAPQSMLIKEFFEADKDLRFSRIPIYNKNRDDVTGYVLKDAILEDIIHDKPAETLGDLHREIALVRLDMPITQLFDQMISSKEHIALVLDDYGSVQGLVTMEDVIETMLGLEIMDESDNVEDMQMLARKNWEKRSKQLGLEKPPEDQEQDA